MLKAILMRLLGLHPVWEVRVVSPTTGKNLPGTRIGKATSSYRKARALYKKQLLRLKVGHTLKLQAVTIAACSTKTGVKDDALLKLWGATFPPGWEADSELLSQLPRDLYAEAQAAASRLAAGTATEGELQSIRECLSTARQIKTPAVSRMRDGASGNAPSGLQQAPAGDMAMPETSPNAPHGTSDVEHDCDFAGEMTLVEGAYRATCSQCGEPQ